MTAIKVAHCTSFHTWQHARVTAQRRGKLLEIVAKRSSRYKGQRTNYPNQQDAGNHYDILPWENTFEALNHETVNTQSLHVQLFNTVLAVVSFL